MPERGRGVFCSWGALGLYGNNWKKMDILAPVGGYFPGDFSLERAGEKENFFAFFTGFDFQNLEIKLCLFPIPTTTYCAYHKTTQKSPHGG